MDDWLSPERSIDFVEPLVVIQACRCRSNESKYRDKFFLDFIFIGPDSDELSVTEDDNIRPWAVMASPNRWFDTYEEALAFGIALQEMYLFERLVPNHPECAGMMNPFGVVDYDHETHEDIPFFVDVVIEGSEIDSTPDLTEEQKSRIVSGTGSVN